MNPDLSDLCCELLSIVLNNNFFLFEDTYYLQIKGSAMGSNVAPPYANAYMAHYEDTSIYTQDLFRSHALTWKRYIDDVFCVWGGDLRTLQAFFQVLRTSWPGLDFTMTYDTHQISFLDTLVIKDDNGNLSTDLYSKPTDRNSLLHYSSFHPKNMIKSIPKSQLNRVSKIVSDPATKDLRTTEMRSKFRERGYPPRILDTAQANSTTRDRISATSRIPFVHQYHPAAYKLHRTIRQHWHILQEAYPTIQEFQHPFLPCFKRPRNIKDNLVRADIGPTHSGPTQRFLANPKTEETSNIIALSKVPSDFLKIPPCEIRGRDWERELRRSTNLELHGATLTEYLKAQRIPRGLRVSLRPTLFSNSTEFCTKFELVLNKCSFDLMVLTLEHLHKEISTTQEQIKNLESQLSSTISVDEFNSLKKKIDSNISLHRRDIELKKRTKFQRDLEDYELNRVYQWQDKSTSRKPSRQEGYHSSVDYTTSDSDPERPGRYPYPGRRFLGRQKRQGKRRGPDGGFTGPRNMDFARVTRSQVHNR
ncbi:unnamed protein product [Ranitomeya imitator]|uniref:Helix-turn-helix domain-containing protein n=1 Tax=Ranitomeya imitator TaxID=111125 RepID=A0ABN9M392_9NEOB|nr:unnamed protein product [Ranitomeya imitator]